MSITHCPKCAYERQPTDRHIHEGVCPACGIAYQKYLDRRALAAQAPSSASVAGRGDRPAARPALARRIQARVLEVPASVDAPAFWARVATLACLGLFGARSVSAGINAELLGASFMHSVILPFHEFGHVLFAPFGRFMMILGGSLFQVLMPLGLMAAFVLRQRDNFGAAVMLWWSGQSWIDLAPYIADAVERALPLVGGAGEESHDWGNLLVMMNMLPHARAMARASFLIGALSMALALGWGASILRLQHQRIGLV